MQLHKGRVNWSCLQWAEEVVIGLSYYKEDSDEISRKLYLGKITKPWKHLRGEAEDCLPLEAFKNWLEKYPAGMTQREKKRVFCSTPMLQGMIILHICHDKEFSIWRLNGKWELGGLSEELAKDRKANYKFLKCFKAQKPEWVGVWAGMPWNEESSKER